MSVLHSRAVSIPLSIIAFALFLTIAQWFFTQSNSSVVPDAGAFIASPPISSSTAPFTCMCTVEAKKQVVYEVIDYTNNISQAWNDCEAFNVDASNFCGSSKTVKKICAPVFKVERGTGFNFADSCACRLDTLPIGFTKPVPVAITTEQGAQQYCDSQSSSCTGIYSSQFEASKTCALISSTPTP